MKTIIVNQQQIQVSIIEAVVYETVLVELQQLVLNQSFRYNDATMEEKLEQKKQQEFIQNHAYALARTISRTIEEENKRSRTRA